MTNYIIAGGVNFYEELYKSLDKTVANDTNDANDDVCLITNLPLTENWVQLNCKHKFNYLPLYNDIVNHKKSFNKLERRFLKATEIRCPYCRNIQQTLLPYCENVSGVKQIHGVNYYDENLALKGNKTFANMEDEYFTGQCAYIFPENPNIITSAFDNTCSNKYVKLLPHDGKTYCTYHKYYIIKEFQKAEKQKAKDLAKDLAKQLKDQAKQEKLQKKVQEKLESTQQKQMMKETATKEKVTKEKITKVKNANNDENVIISNTTDNVSCIAILKSGPKKGSACGCKTHENNMCMRHCKLEK